MKPPHNISFEEPFLATSIVAGKDDQEVYDLPDGVFCYINSPLIHLDPFNGIPSVLDDYRECFRGNWSNYWDGGPKLWFKGGEASLLKPLSRIMETVSFFKPDNYELV